MPTNETLDIVALVTPVSDGPPSGEDQRFLGPYDQIQEARREDTGAQGDWQRDVKRADWSGVVSIATATLLKSKDLQVAAWLTEALANEHGFAGLRDGLTLLRVLQETFWDTVHPRPDEDGDLELRASPFIWMNEKIPVAVRDIPITLEGAEEGGFSSARYEESRHVDNLARQDVEKHAAALAVGKITGEQFDAAFLATPRRFYEDLFVDIEAAMKECDALVQVVLEKFDRHAPSLTEVRQAIDDCRHIVERLLAQKRELEPDLVEVDGAAGTGAAAVRGGGGDGHLRDRAQALSQLNAVASFFRRTEPHSPVAYLVERAVRWAGMPLEAWLSDVIGGETALSTIKSQLGIRDPDESS